MESYQQRLQHALRAMEARLEVPYSLDELAALAGFSPFHFHRIFRGMVGESVKQYERRLRLERAARQLKSGKRTVWRLLWKPATNRMRRLRAPLQRCLMYLLPATARVAAFLAHRSRRIPVPAPFALSIWDRFTLSVCGMLDHTPRWGERGNASTHGRDKRISCAVQSARWPFATTIPR